MASRRNVRKPTVVKLDEDDEGEETMVSSSIKPARKPSDQPQFKKRKKMTLKPSGEPNSQLSKPRAVSAFEVSTLSASLFSHTGRRGRRTNLQNTKVQRKQEG
jgi:hypothetical protein